MIKNLNIKLYCYGFVAVAFFVAPFVSAQTTSNDDSAVSVTADSERTAKLLLISSLKRQIEELKNEIEARNKGMSVLKEGMSGSEIKELQELLATDPKIYPKGIVSGYYGPLTTEAVRRFQSRHNISTTGKVNLETRDVIDEYRKEYVNGKPPVDLLAREIIEEKVKYTLLLKKLKTKIVALEEIKESLDGYNERLTGYQVDLLKYDYSRFDEALKKHVDDLEFYKSSFAVSWSISSSEFWLSQAVEAKENNTSVTVGFEVPYYVSERNLNFIELIINDFSTFIASKKEYKSDSEAQGAIQEAMKLLKQAKVDHANKKYAVSMYAADSGILVIDKYVTSHQVEFGSEYDKDKYDDYTEIDFLQKNNEALEDIDFTFAKQEYKNEFDELMKKMKKLYEESIVNYVNLRNVESQENIDEAFRINLEEIYGAIYDDEKCPGCADLVNRSGKKDELIFW